MCGAAFPSSPLCVVSFASTSFGWCCYLLFPRGLCCLLFIHPCLGVGATSTRSYGWCCCCLFLLLVVLFSSSSSSGWCCVLSFSFVGGAALCGLRSIPFLSGVFPHSVVLFSHPSLVVLLFSSSSSGVAVVSPPLSFLVVLWGISLLWGGAACHPLSSLWVALPSSFSFGCCFVNWPLARPGDSSFLKGQSEPRASGVVGSWVVVSSVIGVMCPTHLCGVASLIAVGSSWEQTSVEGLKKSGSPKTLDSGVVVLGCFFCYWCFVSCCLGRFSLLLSLSVTCSSLPLPFGWCSSFPPVLLDLLLLGLVMSSWVVLFSPPLSVLRVVSFSEFEFKL